eukprot:817561-Pyramimonas_sp.AAC.1
MRYSAVATAVHVAFFAGGQPVAARARARRSCGSTGPPTALSARSAKRRPTFLPRPLGPSG